MRKIFYSGLMALAVLCSCNKQVIEAPVQQPQQDETGRYVKKSLHIGNMTKATASFAEENAINDATIFVYQKNNETGTTIDYEVKYITGNTTDFNLYFSDQTEYTYSFAVWANMGELTDEPVAGDILFADEKDDDLQMRGTVNDVAEADAETISISIKRYVGKVEISNIDLDWTHEMNALKTFKLLEIYLSDVAESDADVPVAAYNLDGVYAASAMDGFIYDDMGAYVLANDASYAQAHYFYAYETAKTEVVIKAELDGEVMYYHFPVSPADNTYKAYSVKIRQIGAEDPLGELPEETIVVSSVTLNVEGWNEAVDAGVDFGDGDVTVTDQVNP